MNTLIPRFTRFAGLLLAALLISVPALGASSSDSNMQTVDGIRIYLGFMPASSAGAVPVNAGGAPPPNSQQITVALFDASSGKRISDAHVEAAVGELGCGDTWKTLHPVTISDTVTYGNYFDMSGKGKIYEIHLRIQWPGHGEVREALFRHRVYDD